MIKRLERPLDIANRSTFWKINALYVPHSFVIVVIIIVTIVVIVVAILVMVMVVFSSLHFAPVIDTRRLSPVSKIVPKCL
jgi:hypothetical protein